MADLIVRAFLDSVLSELAGGYTYPQESINFAIGWAQQEGGGVTNKASFNPLNCGYPATGSTKYNDSGVQVYKDGASAIQATVTNLQESPYSALVHALTTGDLINLGFQARGAPSFQHMMARNVANGLTMWLSGTTDISSHQDYILSVMHNAGISNPNVEGGNGEGSASGQSQSAIDAYGNKVLGQDTSGVTVGSAINNLTNPLSSFFANWTQADVIKIVSGVFLIMLAAIFFIKLQFPQSPIARSSLFGGKK